MSKNKVSEKVIWEGSIPQDNNISSSASQIHQPQMMFCYKCNNVIPANSKYCPCCNVELYAICPKCGVKYSSQYSSCSQCGTNREEYLRVQSIETQRKMAIEREQNRRKEIEERKRLEELRMEKEARRLENEYIESTPEFKDAYAYLFELNRKKEEYNARQKSIAHAHTLFWFVLLVAFCCIFKYYEDFLFTYIRCWYDVILFICMLSIPNGLLFDGLARYGGGISCIEELNKHCPQKTNFKNELTQGIVNQVSEYVATNRLALIYDFNNEDGLKLKKRIIRAYRKLAGYNKKVRPKSPIV